MYTLSLSRRGISWTMAVTTVAGIMAFAAGVADAAPAARPNTKLSIGESHLTGNKYEVFCKLTNASTGAAINGAVVDLDRGGQPDHTGTTSDGGLVTWTVTVDSGTTARFQCIFPGNNSFVSSTSRIISIP